MENHPWPYVYYSAMSGSSYLVLLLWKWIVSGRQQQEIASDTFEGKSLQSGRPVMEQNGNVCTVRFNSIDLFLKLSTLPKFCTCLVT